MPVEKLLKLEFCGKKKLPLLSLTASTTYTKKLGAFQSTEPCTFHS